MTSYQRGGERVPRSWQYDAGGLKIVVTRHIHYPGTWVLQCEPWFALRVLESDDIKDAQAEALMLVREKVEIVLNNLR